MLPESDQYVEAVYKLVNKQDGERMRCEVARIALLAAQFRAQQLARQRTQRAIAKQQAERRALKTARGDGRNHTPAGAAAGSPAPQAAGQGEEQ